MRNLAITYLLGGLCLLLSSAQASEWLGPIDGPVVQADKRIVFLAADFRNGGIVGVYRSFERAAKQVGWQVRAVDGHGEPEEMRRLAERALEDSPDALVLGGVEPQVLVGLIDEFKVHEIPVVGWHAGDRPGPSEQLFTNVTTDPLVVADMAADLVIEDGQAGVVIFTDSQFAIATAKTQRMVERLKGCAQCRVLSVEDVPISQAGRAMAERVKALHRQFGETWTHTLAINDVYFDHINAPLNTVGRRNMRNLSAGDGSAKALGRIRSGLSQQVATVAEPLGAHGWQLVDELNRALTGYPPSKYVASPLLITTDALRTVDNHSIERDAVHEAGYLRLWRQN
ncbi:substrate-binding domain-containing protein [Pseudomonas borbori]